MKELEELGAPLATGRTAEVYPWGRTQVVKLFRPWVSSGAVESERRNAAAVQSLGLPVPAVGGILTSACGVGPGITKGDNCGTSIAFVGFRVLVVA